MRRPILEQLAIGEDALGAGRQGALAQVVVVVLADREDRTPAAAACAMAARGS